MSGDRADEAVLGGNVPVVEQFVERGDAVGIALVQGCGDLDPEAELSGQSDSGHGTRMTACAAVAVVQLGTGRVQADLKRDAVPGHGRQRFPPGPALQQHCVGQQSQRQSRDEHLEEPPDLGMQERLPARQEQLASAGGDELVRGLRSHLDREQPRGGLG